MCVNVHNIRCLSGNLEKTSVAYGNSERLANVLNNTNILSDFEINRLQKFRREIDKNSYMCSHIELRNQLSKITDIKPEKLLLKFPEKGKPYLDKHNFDFSISHSKDNFIVCVADSDILRVGVDIETISEIEMLDDIVDGYMHDDEREYISASDFKQVKIVRFYEMWTRKEAFLKMFGVGLVDDMKSVNMSYSNSKVVHCGINFRDTHDVFLQTIKNDKYVISTCFSEIRYAIVENI